MLNCHSFVPPQLLWICPVLMEKGFLYWGHPYFFMHGFLTTILFESLSSRVNQVLLSGQRCSSIWQLWWRGFCNFLMHHPFTFLSQNVILQFLLHEKHHASTITACHVAMLSDYPLSGFNFTLDPSSLALQRGPVPSFSVLLRILEGWVGHCRNCWLDWDLLRCVLPPLLW